MERNTLVKDYSIGQLEKVLAHGRSQFNAVQQSIPDAEDAQLYVKGYTYGYIACFYTHRCDENWDPNDLSEGYEVQLLLDPNNLPKELNRNYIEIIIKTATEHCLEALKINQEITGEKLFERAYADGYITCFQAYDLSPNQADFSKELDHIPGDLKSLADDLISGWERKPLHH